MPELAPPPKDTALYSAGTGIWATKVENDLNGDPKSPELLARFTVMDPGGFSRDVGVPLWQFRLVRNYNVGAGDTEPSHAALLHCDRLEKILIVPVRLDGDVAASVAWTDMYADMSAVGAVKGTALAAVPITDPDPVASPIEIATTVVAIATVTDNLGVEVFARDKTGHVAPATPSISGTDLGFSGMDLTSSMWTGFVAERSEEDPDLIRVLAGRHLSGAREGAGDLSNSENYVFTVRESDGSLVEGATLVETDIPFIPNQLVSGRPVVLKGGRKKVTWVIGRADPEYYDSSYDGAGRRPLSVEEAAGVPVAGGLGIWSPTDDSWTSWRYIRSVPTGVSHAASHHLDNASVPHVKVPSDVGLSYLPVQQRLTPHTIDTDSGQDPVAEMGKKAVGTPQ